MKQISLFVASGAFSGHFGLAPGTFASFTCALLWLLTLAEASQFAVSFVAGSVILGGWIAVRFLSSSFESPGADPRWIVIDEWAGVLLGLAIIDSIGPLEFLAFMALFRFFDASKLGPVGWAERAPGAYGIMLDDLVAGLLGAALTLIGRSFF